jgi:hypothetical protein
MTEKRQTSQGYIIRILYNISQRNFGILLILWCSFKLWWNFCPGISRSKFHSKGERSIKAMDLDIHITRATNIRRCQTSFRPRRSCVLDRKRVAHHNQWMRFHDIWEPETARMPYIVRADDANFETVNSRAHHWSSNTSFRSTINNVLDRRRFTRLSPVYTTVILGTAARLNFGTRTHAFWSTCCVYTTNILF